MKVKIYPDFPKAPIGPVAVVAGSALPIEVEGVPGGVLAVSVTVTNADVEVFSARAVNKGSSWCCLFPAECFAHVGFVSWGVSVSVTFEDSSGNEASVLFTGNFEVVARPAGVTPGSGAHFEEKGSEIYQRTIVVGGIQHYAKQVLSWDEDMAAWSADWVGDYILVAGEFVPVTGEEDE